METVTLNNTHPMPTLGLGVYMVTDADDCERAVESAIRAGYRLIDTAVAYRTERAVGRGIITSGVPREDIFVTSKIWVSDFGHHATNKALSPAHWNAYAPGTSTCSFCTSPSATSSAVGRRSKRQ